MDKRYTVFVSSTYEDLKEERHHVIQALLRIKCIPVSMEYFPAKSASAWEAITKFIDECDYFVMISAGVYGTLKDHLISFTEAEYNYALSASIPAMAFLYRDISHLPTDKVEREQVSKSRLQSFHNRCKSHALCQMWSTPQELALNVVQSIHDAQLDNPRCGWIRANTQITSTTNSAFNVERRTPVNQRDAKTDEFDFSELDKLQFAVRCRGSYSETDKKKNVAHTHKEIDEVTRIPVAVLFRRLASNILFKVQHDTELENTVWNVVRTFLIEREQPERPETNDIYNFSAERFDLQSIVLQMYYAGLIARVGPIEANYQSQWRLSTHGEDFLRFLQLRELSNEPKPTKGV
ncbi:MAG: DUF4062 domain-containing protein [Candidatus Zixiibacteriota bacterium]